MKNKTSFNLKQVVYISTCIVTLLSCVACSTETEMGFSDEQQTVSSKSIEELNKFNSMLDTRSSLPDKITDKLKVMLSDSYGAYQGAKLGLTVANQLSNDYREAGISVGGATVGSESSYRQYKSYLHPVNTAYLSDDLENEQNSLNSVFAVDITDPAYFDAAYAYATNNIEENDYTLGTSIGVRSRLCVEVGILHNHILKFLSMVDKGFNPKPWWLILTEKEKTIFTNEDFINGREKIRNTNGFFPSTLKTEADIIMDMFVDSILDNGKSESIVFQIIGQYIKTVNASDLSSDDKDALLAGFVVMAYSYDYWKNILTIG